MSQVRVDTEPHGVTSLVLMDNLGYFQTSEAMLIPPSAAPKTSLMQNDKHYSQNM